MPRPRRDSEILPAKERLENAFWELLADREYRKITVTDIVREAQVNRNSFYYHFSGLSELADAAILREVERVPLHGIANRTDRRPGDAAAGAADDGTLKRQLHERLVAALDDPEQREHINRLALIAGPHSAPELMESLRDFSRMSLISALQLDPRHLSLRSDLTLEFAVGGVIAILRRWPELRSRFTAETLFDENLTALAMGVYLSISNNDLREYWREVFREPQGQATDQTADQTMSRPQDRP